METESSQLEKPIVEPQVCVRALGSSPLLISTIGYGAWPLSYNNRPSEPDAIAVLHRALDLGVRFIDTADAYCRDETEKHHNERLIRKALEAYPDKSVIEKVVVATKGIFVRPEGRWEILATVEQIRKAIAGSHDALSGSKRPIDLWQIHDCEDVPLETLLKPVQDALDAGSVRFVGLSNCRLAHIKLAQEVLPVGTLVSVQNRFNMWDRSAERDGVLDYCKENGLAFLPYSALGGRSSAGDECPLRDAHALPNLNRLAKEKGCSPEALVLAYMATKWSCIVHIPSARRIVHLEDNVSSTKLLVTQSDIRSLDKDGDQGEGQLNSSSCH